MNKAIARAAEAIRTKDARPPRLAIVLGSGLGDLADAVEEAVVVPGSEVPGYPASTVQGHQGRLVLGLLEGCPVVVVQGRAHAYEGHGRDAVLFATRLVRELGATHLLLTNAAGGIRPSFSPGTLMWIRDHLNWTDRGTGALPSFDLAGNSAPYDAPWRDAAKAIADRLGVATEEGVYVYTLGPSFETPAEIRAFGHLGGDAVGMSTVPEATEAARLGLRVLGLSTITNAAAGLSGEPLNHEEVLETGRNVRDTLTRLVKAVAAGLLAAP